MQMNVLVLKVEKFTVCLHFSSLKPVVDLSSPAWFPAGERAPCSPARRAMRYGDLFVDFVMFIFQLLILTGVATPPAAHGTPLTGACVLFSHCHTIVLIFCETTLFSEPQHRSVDVRNWNYCHPWNSMISFLIEVRLL